MSRFHAAARDAYQAWNTGARDLNPIQLFRASLYATAAQDDQAATALRTAMETHS